MRESPRAAAIIDGGDHLLGLGDGDSRGRQVPGCIEHGVIAEVAALALSRQALIGAKAADRAAGGGLFVAEGGVEGVAREGAAVSWHLFVSLLVRGFT